MESGAQATTATVERERAITYNEMKSKQMLRCHYIHDFLYSFIVIDIRHEEIALERRSTDGITLIIIRNGERLRATVQMMRQEDDWLR